MGLALRSQPVTASDSLESEMCTEDGTWPCCALLQYPHPTRFHPLG